MQLLQLKQQVNVLPNDVLMQVHLNIRDMFNVSKSFLGKSIFILLSCSLIGLYVNTCPSSLSD